MPNKPTETQLTLLASRRFNRRSFLKTSTGAAAVVLAGPAYVRNARSSSGELNLLNWSDEFPGEVIPNFEKATGIKVNSTPFSQNEEQINKLQATAGEGFDLVQPTHDRAPQFQELGVLGPIDTNKLKNFSAVIPSFVESSQSLWTWDGDLWAEEVKGHVQGRPHSLLAGIGLWLDGNGKLPSNRLLDAYKDPDSFKKIYDEILKVAIEHKPWIKQFWDSADNTKSGLLENDVIIGLTWDGPALSLKKDGKPVNYQAPIEGAITWLDGLAITKASKNVDQAYAFIDYLYTPEVSAALVEGSGYNPVVTGADAKLSDAAKKNFQEAYPGDALTKLWHRPAEPSWFAELRTQYADKYKSA